MFSREMRRLAVGLFFDDGARPSEIVGLLAGDGVVVDRSTVTRWVREDPRYRPPAPGSYGVSYTLETRLAAVALLARTGDVGLAASGVGCPRATVYQWAHVYGAGKGGDVMVDGVDGGLESADEEGLRREIDRLRLENAVMRESIKVLKAGDPGLDPAALASGERARVVEAIRGEFGLRSALKAVGLKRSTYYYQLSVIAGGDRHAGLRARIRLLFSRGRQVWGYRTIHAKLRQDGTDPLFVSEKVVRRIMRQEGLHPIYLKKPKKYSSYQGELSKAPDNLVGRDFHADRPNVLWLTDVTQFTMDGYKCWLSPVIDCFDGMIVSWTLSRSPNAAMANTMLLEAIRTLKEGEHPIIHSDRGCHYRWDEWIRICQEHGLTRSMSAKGCSPDNAAAEGFFGRLKNELFHGRDWKNVTYQQFQERVEEYMTNYNTTRIKKSLGWKSPIQYRQDLGLAV